MDENQNEQFREALERKEEDARERSEAASAAAHDQQLDAHDRPQDTASTRAKGSRHGKVTAENWNQ
jgi:hypothetical protein